MFLWPWINFFSMTISWPVATMLLPANVERLLDVLFKFVDVEVLFRELHCKYVNEQSLAKLISVPPRPLTNCLYFTYFIFHRRPATSFLWFTSPLKTLRYIIWGRYKWYIIGFLLFVIIALLIVLFFYSAPVSFITNQLMIWSLETNHEVFTGKATVKRAAKKRATCFKILLQNELNSDNARFTTQVRTCLAATKIARFHFADGKTRNVAIQLVLKQSRKTSCTFFCWPFYLTLRYHSCDEKKEIYFPFKPLY